MKYAKTIHSLSHRSFVFRPRCLRRDKQSPERRPRPIGDGRAVGRSRHVFLHSNWALEFSYEDGALDLPVVIFVGAADTPWGRRPSPKNHPNFKAINPLVSQPGGTLRHPNFPIESKKRDKPLRPGLAYCRMFIEPNTTCLERNTGQFKLVDVGAVTSLLFQRMPADAIGHHLAGSPFRPLDFSDLISLRESATGAENASKPFFKAVRDGHPVTRCTAPASP